MRVRNDVCLCRVPFFFFLNLLFKNQILTYLLQGIDLSEKTAC